MRFGSLGLGLLCEGVVIEGSFDARDINLEAGAEGVNLVNSLKWDSIDLVRTGDGEEA